MGAVQCASALRRSPPGSIASERKAAFGYYAFVMDENKRLKKEVAKKEKKLEKMVAYIFHRFNSLVAETKHLTDLYNAVRKNCKGGMHLPEWGQIKNGENLGGTVFEKMYAELGKPATMKESESEDEKSQKSHDLAGFDDCGRQGSRRGSGMS